MGCLQCFEWELFVLNENRGRMILYAFPFKNTRRSGNNINKKMNELTMKPIHLVLLKKVSHSLLSAFSGNVFFFYTMINEIPVQFPLKPGGVINTFLNRRFDRLIKIKYRCPSIP